MNQLTCPTCDRHGHVIVLKETPIAKKEDRRDFSRSKTELADSHPENCRKTGYVGGCEILRASERIKANLITVPARHRASLISIDGQRGGPPSGADEGAR